MSGDLWFTSGSQQLKDQEKKLMNHAEKVWEDLRYKPKYIYDIIASMPRRLQSVIEHNGGWTKY